MTNEDMPWVLGLTDEEVQELRSKKQELTQYGKEKIRELMNNQEPIETGIPGLKLKPGGSISATGDAKIVFKTDGKEHILSNTTMTYDEMLEIAAEREAANEAIVAKVSEEDYQKVLSEAARQKLAKKSFEELTKEERIQLALEELAAIVMGGQDGEEYYNSIKFIKDVLESFK